MTSTQVPRKKKNIYAGVLILVVGLLVVHQLSLPSQKTKPRRGYWSSAPDYAMPGYCDPRLHSSCCMQIEAKSSFTIDRPTLTIIGELNVDFSTPRALEIIRAISLTKESNPEVHYAFAFGNLSAAGDISQAFPHVSHDLWYCPEVLYGTLYDIGNQYTGAKIASSIDNWFPPFNLTCSFLDETTQQPRAYLLSRESTSELTDMETTKPCNFYMSVGSWDGILFDHIPPALLPAMRFSRSYWGSENVAGWVLKNASFDLYHLCPTYAPMHVHKEVRMDARVRINVKVNSLYTSFGVTGREDLCRVA